MNDNPYAPPTSVVSDPLPEVSLERPAIVVLAVRLLWAGFAVSCVNSIYGLFRLPAGVPVGMVVTMMTVGLVVAGLISWGLFTALWRGKGWARWVIGVLIVLSVGTVTLIWSRLPPTSPIPWQSRVPVGIRMILYVSALIMLFTPTANAWYRERKRWL